MSNPQGGPGNSLGLAVGATNLACTGDGQRTLIQPATVTLRPDLRLTGFVDRVGDPIPIIAADGSRHRPEMLLAEALDRVARSAAMAPVSEVAVAVPAHWRPFMVDALREALGRKAGLARSPLVTDATAAVTALRSNPGLPSTGVIVLCDFGGSGSSITLIDAAADAPIGDTVRVPDFSGDQLDQAVLSKVVAGILDASHADPAGTAMVGSLARLRDECRRAKERLSDETATGIVVDVPGGETTVRMTRMELDDLINEPLSEFMAALGDTLDRNRVPLASVSAVATVGGGARIPLVTQRLSEYLRAGVVTTPQPQLTVAEGVALIARRGQIVETATAMAPAAPATATVAAAAFAGAAAPAVGALAWSEVDDDEVDEVMAVAPPFEHDYPANPVESRPELHFEHDEWEQQAPSRRRSPVLLFGLAAAAVAVAAVVFGLTAFTRDTPTVPAGSTASIAPAAPAPAADSAPAVQQAQAQAPAPVPSQAPAVTTVMARPAPQVVEQQPMAAEPAPAAPAPAAAPAPEAPAPEAPAPEAPAPAPAPANPAPASPWTPPWTPPWKLPTHNGAGTPPAGPGTGTSTGGTNTGADTGGTGAGASSGTGSGASAGTGTGTDTGTSTGSGGSAKGPIAPGLIPIVPPGN